MLERDESFLLLDIAWHLKDTAAFFALSNAKLLSPHYVAVRLVLPVKVEISCDEGVYIGIFFNLKEI